MMKKVLLGFLLLISGFFFLFNKTKMIDSEDLAVYVNDELQDSIPKKGEAMFINAVCDNGGKASWDNDNWGILVTNMTKKTRCNLYFYEGDTVFDFDYTGGEQVFTVPVSGTYKLETWGAQGGSSLTNGVNQDNNGGIGGYSIGKIKLQYNQLIYISVGGKGGDGKINVNDTLGGYNGGGLSHWDKSDDEASGGGGGSTHIATKQGLLSSLENYKSEIIIVSGGGGGASWNCTSGIGGGFKGTNSYNSTNGLYASAGSQNSGYKFGLGGDGSNSTGSPGGGGGGGYYGGFGGYIADYNDWHNDAIPGAGGSGYIGNPLLKDKAMYCYNCEESNEETTKTISTTCSEETPTENCAKKGNGYARITLVTIDE